MIEIILNVLGGLANGAAIAGLGYAKSHGAEGFDKKKFLQTAIVGGFVGGFAFTAQMTYDQASMWAAGSGMITVVEYVKKTAWRWLKLKKQE